MATSSIISGTGEELSFGRMGESIKGSSRMRTDMDMLLRVMLMETDTLESGRITIKKDMDASTSLTVLHIKGWKRMERGMAMESSIMQMETSTKASC